MFRLGGRWMGRVAASGGLREAMAATTGRRMLLCGPRWTRYASTTSTNTKDEGVVYEFDPVASLRHDAAVETAKRSIGAVLEEILPPGAPDSAVAKVRAYLEQYPVDELITSAQVQITHIQNAESGAEDRVSLSPCTLDEALEQAKLRGLNVVQMGSREDMAYCRLREERPRILATVAEELQSASTEGSGAAPHQPAKKSIDHVFRDAVDAHFVGWRSKKICVDLQRGHPVKLTIKDFQSAESAMLKLREMAQAIHAHATEMGVAHHYTSLNGSDREASLSLVPSGPPGSRPKQAAQGNKQNNNNNNNTPAVNVRHPGEKEWAHALRKMQSSCKSAGRLGTYMKSGAMKPRNVGSTTYRVDKYGRRVG